MTPYELELGPPQLAVYRTLVAAYELLDRPAKWTQGVTARRADGRECGAIDRAAVQWSAGGAIARVAPTLADVALATKCVLHTLKLPTDNPTALWAWEDGAGRTFDGVRTVLFHARRAVVDVVSGKEPLASRLRYPEPVLPWTDGSVR